MSRGVIRIGRVPDGFAGSCEHFPLTKVMRITILVAARAQDHEMGAILVLIRRALDD
jgi:hypothetical protein